MKLMPLKPLLLACLALASTASHAQFYEVEMTVFSQGEQYAKDQTWPNDIQVQYPASVTGLSTRPLEELYPELAQPGQPANPGLVPLLDASFARHGEPVRKLEQAGKRILFSHVWLQKIEGANTARNIIIQGGRLEANVHELGGTVSFYLTPSPDNKPDALHMTSHLWLATRGQASGDTRWPVPPAFSIEDQGPVPMPVDNHAQLQRVAVLDDNEIITPSALHYIDHPLFGVLVEVRPYRGIGLSE